MNTQTNALVTVSLRCGIATPDGGFSSVLVGYFTKVIEPGKLMKLSDGLSLVAQQQGFLLEAGGCIVLVYDDAIAGVCPCIIPPAEACDLRKFNFQHAQENLDALKQYAESLSSMDAANEG